jgi:predicted metal-dependent HD superfamily phosphohydrolase
MPHDELELRIAWEQHLGSSGSSRGWFDSVLAGYRRPDRHYHDARHVRWVVRHVIALAGHTDDIGAVIAAAFFHDAAYDATRGDNEAVSAQLAERALDDLDWSPERRRRVVAMIEATATHDVENADADTKVLLAADLAVLAAEPSRYGDYVRAVRREYAHVDDTGWREGRSAVLHRLLDLPHLFASSLGLDEWEQRARANITDELAALRD